MITLVKGEPALVRTNVRDLVLSWQQAHPDSDVIRRDGNEIDRDELMQILQGGGLFASEQLLVLHLAGDTSELTLITTLLKGTQTDCVISLSGTNAAFIATLKGFGATIIDLSKNPTARERRAHAETYIKTRRILIKPAALTTLLEHTDASGQALEHELDKLALLGREITADDCRLYAVAGAQANIFAVFDLASGGQRAAAETLIDHLSTSEIPHQALAVMTGTIASLASVAAGDTNGIHPFVASKLQNNITRRGEAWVTHCLEAAIEAEHMMKRTRADEWHVVRWLVGRISS